MTEFTDREFMAVASPVWQSVLRFGLATILALFYLTASLHFAHTPDDTYVYLRYARNLAHGDGFAFNAGSPGSSLPGPLWVAFIAAGAKVGLDPYVVAKTFDLVFASLSVLLAHMLTFLLTRDRVYALVGAVLVAADVWILSSAGSGTESSMAMFVCLLTVRYIITREYSLAAFGSGVLTLLRPEGILLVAVVLVPALSRALRHRAGWRSFGYPVLFVAMPLAPWIVYAFVSFGSFTPFAAGASNVAASAMTNGGMSREVLSSAVIGSQAVAVALLAGSLVSLLSVRGRWRQWPEAGPLAFVSGIFLSAFLLENGLPPRAFMFALPLVPISALWSLKALELRSRWRLHRSAAVLGAVVLFALAQNVFVFTFRIIPRLVAHTRSMEECVKPIGYWLRNNTPALASVLSEEVGMIGYISERRVIKAEGPITPGMPWGTAPVLRDGITAGRPNPLTVAPDFVLDRASAKERLACTALRPVMTRESSPDGAAGPAILYYTLYRVEH